VRQEFRSSGRWASKILMPKVGSKWPRRFPSDQLASARYSATPELLQLLSSCPSGCKNSPIH
jgi:hypothetical protein